MSRKGFIRYNLKTIALVLLHSFSIGILAQFNGGNHNNGEQFYAELPFEYTYDKIVINASINGIEGRYLLDTGAMCILFKDSTEHSFIQSDEIRVGDASGKKQVAQVVVANEIKIGGLEYNEIPILYVDVFEGPFKCLGYKGIIGSNLLRFGAFKVDWQTQTLIIADSYQRMTGVSSKGSKLRVNKQQSSPFVKVKVNDKDIKWVLIDTGSGDTFSLSNQTADWLDKRSSIGSVLYVSDGTNSHGAWGAGEYETKIYGQMNMQIAQSLFTDAVIEVVGAKSRIGMKVLERADFILDYPQKRFFFNVQNTKPISMRSFGVDIIMKDDRFLVNGIWKHSRADSLGIEKGDVLLGVEDVDFKGKSPCQVFLSLKELTEDKEDLNFTIQKGKGEIVETFSLSRIKF